MVEDWPAESPLLAKFECLRGILLREVGPFAMDSFLQFLRTLHCFRSLEQPTEGMAVPRFNFPICAAVFLFTMVLDPDYYSTA